MKRVLLLSVLVVFGFALLSGCATMPKTWPDYERSAENKLVIIQEKIGEGLKTGALTPDHTQIYLTTLKSIRTDYTELQDKRVYRNEWDTIFARLDALEDEIDRTVDRPSRIDEPRNGERIIALQRRIDDARNSRPSSTNEWRDMQERLDSIRRDYLRMTEDGRYTTREESADISRRLDSLEMDINRYQ
ncbi:MAG: hypothetical protein R6T90_05010 [Dissulfuribacterales bacterium]